MAETRWTSDEPLHMDAIIEAFEHRGLPVIVYAAGRYPSVSDGTRSTRTAPHIEIVLGALYCGGETTYTSVTVIAVGTYVHGRRRQLEVWRMAGHRDPTPGPVVAHAKRRLDEAAETVGRIDALFEAAGARVAQGWAYETPLAREDYEAACAKLGVEALSDEACDSYGVRWGDFAFPEYPADHVVRMHLARLRLRQIEAERESRPPPSEARGTQPAKEGQIWQRCSCGREPVYLPLMVCEVCWPRA